jgi:hypothetical protein
LMLELALVSLNQPLGKVEPKLVKSFAPLF